MKSEYTGTLWHCDGCGREQLVGDPDTLPIGYTGFVRSGIHGASWDFYACRGRCLHTAILNAGARAEPQG
jgi:hypothetical protein